MLACFWSSNHCIPAQKLVHVNGIKSKPFTVGIGLQTRLCAVNIMVYMKWIDCHSRVNVDVTVGSWRVNGLHFADRLMVLKSSEHGLQHARDHFLS